ncbi:MAG: methylmalonyl-CoA mutase [Saprospiraceae bacterium]|nr:methylmalonyl-CoA mutase [Saprospiraceae bacterium]
MSNGDRKQEQTADEKRVFLESGIEVKTLYTREDALAGNPQLDAELPGQFPFTRGIHPLMYRKRPFTMRQYAGFASPEETNERFHFLIRNGQTGLNVAFDLPTQCGLDSDDPAALGEVGRVGMAVDSLDDFERAFAGIDLSKITVSMTINGSALVLMAMYFALAEKWGYDLSTLRGTAQNDILKEFIGRGTWIFPVDKSVKLVVDTIEYCARNVPRYSPVSVCGYHIRESGANPVQEMAYAFCIAKAYSEETLKRGVPVDEFASRLSYNFDIYGYFFEQIAKFRAGRRLWAKIVREEYGAQKEESCWLRMIAGGGGAGLTKEQPENNIIRTAYFAMVSALSGTQTMALCTYDEAYTIPTEKAAEIALRTMQILTHETGVCDTVDPLGGSYYVETLTNQFETAIRQEMAVVDTWGGIVDAIASGKVQEAIAHQAYQRECDIQQGRIVKVGFNAFYSDEDRQQISFHPYNQEAADKQITRLSQIRAQRNAREVDEALGTLRLDAQAGKNLMPATIRAVKAYATVGEIIRVLREVYGEYEEPVFFNYA